MLWLSALVVPAALAASDLPAINVPRFTRTAALEHPRLPLQGYIAASNEILEFHRVRQLVVGKLVGRHLQLLRVEEGVNGTISGEVDGKPVKANFLYSPERYRVESQAGEVLLEADWLGGRATGRGIELTFNLENGPIKGSFRGSEVDLSFDKFSGQLQGSFDGRQIDLQLTNVDLSHFLSVLWAL